MSSNSSPTNQVFYWVLIFIGCVLMSCGPLLNDSPKKRQPLELGRGDAKCLDNWKPVVNRYFEGEATEADVDGFWGCLDKVVSRFEKSVRGAHVNEYSVSELKKFLEDFFFTEQKKIPDGLVEQFRILKQAIFGNDKDKLSAQDLVRIHRWIENFKNDSLLLRRHMRIISFTAFKKGETPNAPTLQAAIATIKEVSKNWSINFGTVHRSYSIDNFVGFVKELENFFTINKQENLLESDFDKYVAVFKGLKTTFVNVPDDWIHPSDWSLLYRQAGDLLSIALLKKYELNLDSAKALVEPQGLAALTQILEATTLMFKRSMAFHPQKTISANEIFSLVNALKEVAWFLPKSVSTETLKVTYQKIVGKLLRDIEESGHSFVDDGFDLKKLARLEQHIVKWLTVQQFFTDVYYKNGSVDLLKIPNALQKWAKAKGANFHPTWEAYSKNFRSNIDELRLFLEKSPYSLGILNNKLQAFLGFSENSSTREFMDLTSMNWIRSVMQIIIQGYAQDQERAVKTLGVTKDELQEFYKDVREIGIELELLDKRSVKGGERTFLEANLFTLKGDGNNILSWVEGYQELSNLMSGASVAQDIYDGIIKARSCPISGNKNLGIFGQRKIDFSCLKKNMRKNFSKYFADLPGIAEYVDGLSNNRWESFFLALTQVSPLNDFDGKWVELSHVRAFAVIVHFVETVILRYDFEHKGYLDDVEVDIAFRTYKGFLAIAWEKIQGTPAVESDLRAVFSYFLMYGKAPIEGNGMWAAIGNGWRFYKHKWLIDAKGIKVDRLSIIKALAAYAAFIN